MPASSSADVSAFVPSSKRGIGPQPCPRPLRYVVRPLLFSRCIRRKHRWPCFIHGQALGCLEGSIRVVGHPRLAPCGACARRRSSPGISTLCVRIRRPSVWRVVVLHRRVADSPWHSRSGEQVLLSPKPVHGPASFMCPSTRKVKTRVWGLHANRRELLALQTRVGPDMNEPDQKCTTVMAPSLFHD